MSKHIIKLQTNSTSSISYTTKRNFLLTEDEVRGSVLCTMTPTVTQFPCNSALFNLKWILDSLISVLSAILYFISMLDIFGLLKKNQYFVYNFIYITTMFKINKGFRITKLRIKHQNTYKLFFICQHGSIDKNEMSNYGSHVTLNFKNERAFIKHMLSMNKLLHYMCSRTMNSYSLPVTMFTAGQMYSHYSDPWERVCDTLIILTAILMGRIDHLLAGERVSLPWNN